MNYKRFLQEIERGKIEFFYLFEGKEKYLKKEALKKLKEKLLEPVSEDFNFQILDASQHTAKEIVEAAYQLPLNNKWQLIVVEKVEKLSSLDQEKIIDYLKEPVNSTCLIFSGEEINSESKLYQFFKERGKLVLFHPFGPKEAVTWIREKVARAGKKINFEAALMLAEYTEGDVFSLNNEVEKLTLFVHPKKLIEQSDVLQLLGETGNENIFTLLGAFRERNLRLCLQILDRLFFGGKEPLFIQSMLVREIRILLRLKLAGSEITPVQACEYIFKKRKNYTNFFLHKAKEYINAARLFTLPQLLFAQERILTAEFLIKKGKQQPETALQQAILDILTNGAGNYI